MLRGSRMPFEVVLSRIRENLFANNALSDAAPPGNLVPNHPSLRLPFLNLLAARFLQNEISKGIAFGRYERGRKAFQRRHHCLRIRRHRSKRLEPTNDGGRCHHA